MSDDSYLNLTPNPLSLIESLRDIGYSMDTAMADIVDNCITANARQIWIRFSWNSGFPCLAIIDNGNGMSRETLRNAMRFGSMSPLETRSPNDLGRFGLGMKTASLSQCRHLTVVSQQAGEISGFEWDLDRLAADEPFEWRIGEIDTENITQDHKLSALYNQYLSKGSSGTVVLWQSFDRIDKQESSREATFNALMTDARHHLELVFHRFLTPFPGKKRLLVYMNGDPLLPFDPFNTHNPTTTELPEQRFSLNGQPIVIRPYILPHHSKVSKEEYEKYAGDVGYLHNQGFYLYRNRRLIIKGTWFRLIKKEELNKLLRIRVDIPNTLDHLWKIDIKKSDATPPESIRKEFRQVIGRIQIAGKNVFEQRGSKLTSLTKTPVWNRRATQGRISYQINREHPLFTKLLEILSVEQKSILHDLIATIESSFPVDTFYHDAAVEPEHLANPNIEEAHLEQILCLFLDLWKAKGLSDNEVVENIQSTDPFASHRELTGKILQDRGYVL